MQSNSLKRTLFLFVAFLSFNAIVYGDSGELTKSEALDNIHSNVNVIFNSFNSMSYFGAPQSDHNPDTNNALQANIDTNLAIVKEAAKNISHDLKTFKVKKETRKNIKKNLNLLAQNTSDYLVALFKGDSTSFPAFYMLISAEELDLLFKAALYPDCAINQDTWRNATLIVQDAAVGNFSNDSASTRSAVLALNSITPLFNFYFVEIAECQER